MIENLKEVFSGRRVLVTGHTGFKGSWLTRWLRQMNADVTGYALDAPTDPSLWSLLNLGDSINDIRGDVSDLPRITNVVEQLKPDFVFHLAAQPIVRQSYRDPVSTFHVNAMGTVYVLDAIRQADHACVAVMVTTDKCYLNREWEYGYRENDALGGNDPYSASKAMAELAIHAYRHSFADHSKLRIASARAGNVIGGGDWAADRIVPDCIASLASGKPVRVRCPQARRPWQHVLDSLHGYLQLAAAMDAADSDAMLSILCTAFNFGPPVDSNRTVGELVDAILPHYPGGLWIDDSDRDHPHEATRLNLATDKAAEYLDWHSKWDFQRSVDETVSWYTRIAAGEQASDVLGEQIKRFEST